MSRRIKPADQTDDGSNGQWLRGLPAEAARVGSSPEIRYDAQAGCPVEHAGGRFDPNVSGAPAPADAPSPRPFKLGR